MMACYARLHSTIYAVQGRSSHATPCVIRACVQSKIDNGMQCRRHPTVCTILKAMMTFNARRRSTVCYAKGDDSIAIHNIVRWGVHSMVDDNMARSTLSNCECCPRAMMVCHARCYSTLSMLFKGDDGLPRQTSFDRMFLTRSMMAYLA